METRPIVQDDLAPALARIDGFVRATRTAVFVRRADNLLLIRPEKTLGINETGADIIEALYDRRSPSAAEALAGLARKYRVELARLAADADALLQSIGALMRDDFSPRPGLQFTALGKTKPRYPVLAEIAVTYACQNRCEFCYAASPHREGEHRLMTTGEVKSVMDRIFHEAHVPSLSFTGGEATLRKDLPELVRHGAELGLRINLITNGVRLADPQYARTLVDAGLASAQVSIEAADAALHDALVGRKGSFEATVAGVRNLAALGIHVHTNTTLCQGNLGCAEEIVRFAARVLGRRTMSMNMLIRTGMALGSAAAPVAYSEIARRLPRVLEVAREEGIKLVWYSPIPYCLLNPVLVGQGAKSCACVDGILSVNPAGEVLPCSSFNEGLGSLLEKSYEEIRTSQAAQYWRRREYVPPPCAGCPDVDVCAGACPLYWDAAGSFAELPRPGAGDPDARRVWGERRRRGASFGVPYPEASPADPAAPGARAGAQAWDG